MADNHIYYSEADFLGALSRVIVKTLHAISKRGTPLTQELLATTLEKDPEFCQALKKTPVPDKKCHPAAQADLEKLVHTLEKERDAAQKALKNFKQDVFCQGVKVSDNSEARVCPRRFRFSLLSVLDLLRLDIGADYSGEIDGLINEAQSAETSRALADAAQKILLFVGSHMENLHDEREQNSEFLKAVDKNLLEIEGRVSGSHAHIHQSQAANDAFYGDMAGRVKDINQTLSTKKPVSNLREILLEKMKLIKTVLREKRAEDLKRLKKADKRNAELNNSLKGLIKQVNETELKVRILKEEAMVDPLTKIPNRRAYGERLSHEWERYRRYGDIFSMLMLDLDHFKKINDDFGHAVGDKCLAGVVGLIRPKLRTVDFPARYGGEEFVVILPGTAGKSAVRVAEKLRKKIENAKFVYDAQTVKVTVSIGVTQVADTDQNPDQLFARVDAAMYEAKNKGRNQVVWKQAEEHAIF